MIPFWEGSRELKKYKKEIMDAVEGCVDRGELVLGYLHEIENFEKAFAELIGVRHAVMCGGGTHALLLAYRALDFGGGEVITTPHTFIATIDQIVAVGGTPVLADIDPVTGLIDPKEIEKKITPRTKGIVPVHLEGKVCDMEAIMSLAEKYNLKVVEDAAQAIGAYGPLGSAGGVGDVGCFSFYPAKVLGSLGNAGAAVTNDDALAERMRMLRCNYNIGRANRNTLDAEYGYQLEPDAIHAAVLNVKLKYLMERLRIRKEIADRYNEAFQDLPIVLPFEQEGRTYQDYVIRVPERKHDLVAHLTEKGVGVGGVDLIPNHHYKRLGLEGSYPHTDEYMATQIRIPCNPDLEEHEIQTIIEAVTSFYK